MAVAAVGGAQANEEVSQKSSSLRGAGREDGMLLFVCICVEAVARQVVVSLSNLSFLHVSIHFQAKILTATESSMTTAATGARGRMVPHGVSDRMVSPGVSPTVVDVAVTEVVVAAVADQTASEVTTATCPVVTRIARALEEVS